MALEGLGAQMCDAVTLEVLRPGEGFPTTLLCADEATVIIMFPDKHREGDFGQSDIVGTTGGRTERLLILL